MANIISYLPVILPLFNLPHVCIIWSLVCQIINIHLLIAKSESSGQYVENSGFNASVFR